MGQEVKLITTGLAAGVVGWINSFAIDLFNVPLNVVIMAGGGALLSHAYSSTPEKMSRKKFYFSLVANTFTACAAVSVLPASMGWAWYDIKMEGSMAFLFALCSRFAIPTIFKMVPEIVRKWFKIGEYKDETK